MYAACGARPDIAYPVFRLCSAMSRPTPDLFIELNTLLSYLHYHKSLGITYNTGPSALSGCSDANLSTYDLRHIGMVRQVAGSYDQLGVEKAALRRPLVVRG